MKIVMKFGGASISSGEDLIKALNIVKDHLSRDDQVIIIASAFDNITDALQDAAEKASRGEGDAVEARLREIESRHIAIIENAIIFDESLRREASERLGNQIRELETILRGVMSIRELSCRSRDYILSFGERFAAPIMADALADSSLRARCFEGGEAGIVTDDSFGEARPLIELTRYEVQKRLSALERGTIPVIAGFIARTQDGSVTTLGRGGSDLTATLVGRSVGADEVWLWSNVDGLMTADPEIVPDARPLGSVTFLEAQEMAYFGARVIHPMALEPAREGGIKVRIKNLHNPSQAGTVIGGWLTSETAGVVRSLALIRDVALLTVSGAGMAGAPGVAARVFSALGSERINVLMISQGSSEANISLVIPRGRLLDALNTLELRLLGNGYVQEVAQESDVCIIAAIGTGMKGTPGVAARIFKAVADAGVNVRMIAQGSSELNISFVVKEADGAKAVRALHEEFRLAVPGVKDF